MTRAETAATGLRWPTLSLAAWCAFLFAWWLPVYLTRPWFTDHDHFALLARAWSQGRLPYRDVFSAQFPGELYLFRAVGEGFGWGNSVAFYAVDAASVFFFGVLLAFWSRKRFGGALPGLVGFDVFLTYYLSQDFDVTAQREWHASFLAASAFFVIDLFPGLFGRAVSGVAFGAAMAFRPQVVLVVPGLWLALDRSARAPEESLTRTVRAWAVWVLAAGLTLAAAFAPLARLGLLADFLRCFRSIGFGAGFSAAPGERLGRVASLLAGDPALVFLVAAAVAMSRRGTTTGRWRGTASVLVALLGTFLYGAVSPLNHVYFRLPVKAFEALVAACVVGPTLRARGAATAVGVSALVIGLAAAAVPRHVILGFGPPGVGEVEVNPAGGRSVAFSDRPVGSRTETAVFVDGPAATDRVVVVLDGKADPVVATAGDQKVLTRVPPYGPAEAIRDLRRGVLPETSPPGRREWFPFYPWAHYRSAVEHLRSSTTPGTPFVSLLLESNTGIHAMIPRDSPLPCDPIGMLLYDHLYDKNLAALAAAEECVVAWDPLRAENVFPKFAGMFRLVRENYRFEARFGRIEIWRRRR